MNITLFDGQVAATALLQGVVALLFIGGLWFALDKFTRFDDFHEIMVKHNWAYLVQRAGILIGQTLGIASCFTFTGRWGSIGGMAMGAAWVTFIILVAYPIVDRALGRATKPQEANEDGMSVSLIKGAAHVTIGLVLAGALSGASPDIATAIAATAVFTALGLAAVVGSLYIHTRGLKYDLIGEARNGEMGASFELAGALIAVGILLRNAIAGDFVGWVAGLAGFGITFGVSLILLYAYRVIAGKVVFRHCTVNGAQRKDAVGPAVLLAILLPVTALLVSYVVIPIAGILA